ncbi:MAG: hypothetical protein U1E10_11670 [Bdellovibrionales bacterium]|nr:hypothetical protein [Bdellovibrionales bacterium]
MKYLTIPTFILVASVFTAASAQDLNADRLNCFAKLNQVAAKPAYKLNDGEFLFDTTSSRIFKVSIAGLQDCSLADIRAQNNRVYISYRSDGQAADSPATIFSYASMDSTPGEGPIFQPGFSALSKYEKAMVKARDLVPLTCKPVPANEEAKVWNQLILGSQAKAADFKLGLKYLATLLPLVKAPDQAPYRDAISTCRKIDDKDLQRELADLQLKLDKNFKPSSKSGTATAK